MGKARRIACGHHRLWDPITQQPEGIGATSANGVATITLWCQRSGIPCLMRSRAIWV